MLNITLNKIFNKFDILYILFIIFISVTLIFSSSIFFKNSSDKAIVKYNNKEIMKIDLKQNQIIKLEKKKYPLLLDDMIIEVKNGGIAVIKEKSPYNYCQLMGAIRDSSRAIICQPNKVVIMIESKNDENNSDIDVIVR